MGTREDTRPKDDREQSRTSSVMRVTTTIGIVAFAFAALWFVVNLLYALL